VDLIFVQNSNKKVSLAQPKIGLVLVIWEQLCQLFVLIHVHYHIKYLS